MSSPGDLEKDWNDKSSRSQKRKESKTLAEEIGREERYSILENEREGGKTQK